MKNILTGIILISILLFQGCKSEDSSVEFTVLHSSEQRVSSDEDVKTNKVLSAQNDYEIELLKYSNDEAFTIDFTKNNVLVAYMGQKGSGGYSIGVSSVKEYEEYVLVTLVSMEPYDCAVTLIITNPFQFVKIASKKRVEIKEEVKRYNCSSI